MTEFCTLANNASYSFIRCRTMIFKIGLKNIGYGNSTFIIYHDRRDNEFGLNIDMDNLNQGEHLELDSTHLGGTEKTM